MRLLYCILYLLLLPSLCFAGKKEKFVLPDAPPAQQWEYIGKLMRDAQSRIATYDYSTALQLLDERSELLEQYYEKNGTSGIETGETGYEYLSVVPKLYCNLRMGRVAENMEEISRVRTQYIKRYGVKHPQDDLLETEVAETYFRMENIGMAIETAEKLVDRLLDTSGKSTTAYYKIYHRLMAYYKAIGRTGTVYFDKTYTPENELDEYKNIAEEYVFGMDIPFAQKIAKIMEGAVQMTGELRDYDARALIKVGMSLLDREYPEEKRLQNAETAHKYNLLKSQLLSVQARSYDYFSSHGREPFECMQSNYELKKKLYGANSAEAAEAAEILGRYYWEYAGNDIELATKYYHEAYVIMKSSEAYRKEQLIDIIGVLMECYADRNEPQAVAAFAKELIVLTKQLVVSSFAVSSSAERAALWDKYNHWMLKDIPRLALLFEGRIEMGAELYDIALFSKGLLMMSDNAMTELAMRKASPELKQDGRKLHNLRLQLHRQLTSSNFSDTRKVSDTRREIEELEHSLVARVSSLGDWQNGLNVCWQDVQKQLKKGETAIEFLEYDGTIWEKGAIVAIVLSADSYCPIMRKLCAGNDLVYSSYFAQCGNTDFYDNYWQNLESDLKETHTVFFAPIGVLNTIPIEYCPINDQKSLFDKYNIYRLTSTRKILERSNSRHTISSAYLFGGIDYRPDLLEISRANVQLINEGYIENGTSGLDKDMTLSRELYDKLYIPNNYSLMNIYKTTLASTLLLSDQLQLMGCDTHLFTDFRATEECIKGMSAKPVDLLYINTHGFTKSKSADVRNYTFTYKNLRNNVSESEMSMTRSGLLLTGASMAYSPTCNRMGLEDGVITAAEIAQLNLKHLKLVYLSACETGLGEVTPEGVLGLQRGFKRAGAEALITTLSTVNATTSLYFDSTFFTSLLYESNGKKKKKQSIHDAFTTSVKKLRSAYKDPQYWCVNVLIDALD